MTDLTWEDEERIIAAKYPPPAPAAGFRSFSDRIKGEREDRMQLAGRTMSFGVKFLDKALGGIFPRDLVLVGAKTGIGKTALSSITALTNAIRGKRVYYFALEAEPNEIERRMKYVMLAKYVYANSVSRMSHERMNYLDWSQGRLEDVVGPYEDRADAELSQAFKTLFTFYRQREFTMDDLERNAMAVQDELDLLILDHLHYIDTEDANENRGLKLITKRIRDLALSMGKPVVCVAHVRKGDRKVKQLVPDLEDFHGSSDISKIATKAVMLAPAHDQPTGVAHLWNTYIAVRKCRADGSRARYCATVPFNAKTNSYEEEFTLGRLKNGDEEWESINNSELPLWGRS